MLEHRDDLVGILVNRELAECLDGGRDDNGIGVVEVADAGLSARGIGACSTRQAQLPESEECRQANLSLGSIRRLRQGARVRRVLDPTHRQCGAARRIGLLGLQQADELRGCGDPSVLDLGNPLLRRAGFRPGAAHGPHEPPQHRDRTDRPAR